MPSKYWFENKEESAEFFKEKSDVFRSMDARRIREFGKKWRLSHWKWIHKGEGVDFWTGVHQMRLWMGELSIPELQKSYDWLVQRNIRPCWEMEWIYKERGMKKATTQRMLFDEGDEEAGK